MHETSHYRMNIYSANFNMNSLSFSSRVLKCVVHSFLFLLKRQRHIIVYVCSKCFHMHNEWLFMRICGENTLVSRLLYVGVFGKNNLLLKLRFYVTRHVPFNILDAA